MADAAEALLAADAMLAANPDLQAARAAHVEVCSSGPASVTRCLDLLISELEMHLGTSWRKLK